MPDQPCDYRFSDRRTAFDELIVSYELRDGYLHVKATGAFVPAKARDLFLEALEMARRHATTRLLCDITLVTGLEDQLALTMTRFDMAAFVGETIPKGFKLAVLETPQQIGRDRFAENVMVNKGAAARETSNLNEALEWLGLTPANKADAGIGR